MANVRREEKIPHSYHDVQVLNGLAPHYLCDQISLIADTYNRYSTRSTNTMDVVVPMVNRSVFKRSFIYNGALTWNALPDFIRRANSISHFKTLYKKFYFE